MFNGKSSFFYEIRYHYLGDTKDVKETGFGTYKFSNGDKHEGYYLNDDLHGNGKFTKANGTTIEGTWKNGM